MAGQILRLHRVRSRRVLESELRAIEPSLSDTLVTGGGNRLSLASRMRLNKVDF